MHNLKRLLHEHTQKDAQPNHGGFNVKTSQRRQSFKPFLLVPIYQKDFCPKNMVPVEKLAHVVVSLVEGEEPGVVLRLGDEPHTHQTISNVCTIISWIISYF